MAGKRLEIELPAELFSQLAEVARETGIGSLTETAVIGLAQWVSQRRAEIGERDPNQKYFVNEALDELAKKQK
jgi:hypothetical protein